MRVPEISNTLIQLQPSSQRPQPGPPAKADGPARVGERALDTFEPSRSQAPRPADAQPSTVASAISAAEAQPLYTAADRDALLERWGARSGDESFDGQYDLNGDGVISAPDLARLLGAMSGPRQNGSAGEPMPFEVSKAAILDAWGAREGEDGFDARLDLDGDGVIGSSDLASLLGGQQVEGPPTARGDEQPSGTGPVDRAAILDAWGAREGDARYDPSLDLDSDGVIGASDLAETLGRYRDESGAETDPPGPSAEEQRRAAIDELLRSWGARFGQSGFNPQHDLNGDNVIGAADLANLLGSLAR